MVFASGCATARKPSTQQFLSKEMLANEVAADTRVHVESDKKKGVWHAVLFYLPNRVLDVVDIFSCRARVGLGLAANVRITDYADVFMGQYNAVYVGLPGPRMGKELGWFAGREQEKGLKLLGVDATDSLPHERDYSPTEFNMGAHLLILGVEIGFDPVELGDFLTGLIMIDVREDDW